MKNKKTDFVVFKTKDDTCLYHVPTKRRMLFSKDMYERFKKCLYDDENDKEVETFLDLHFQPIKEECESVLKRLEIMTCTCCNLDCKYCYAHGGNYDQKEKIMEVEQNNKILDFLMKIPNDIEEVKFFGGEPFLGYKNIVNTCEWFTNNYKRAPKFKAVTNMTYLPEELLEAIIKYNIIITVSLDGPEEINNQLRYSNQSNLNVYQRVIDNLKRLKNRGYQIQAIECTYTDAHIRNGYTKEMLENYFKETFNVQQVIIADEYHPDSSKIQKFNYEKYINTSDIMDSIDLELITRCLSPNHSGGGLCQVGNKGLTFMPNGDVYPCHMFVYNQNFKIGNINDVQILDQLDSTNEKLNTIRKEVGCTECRARNICSQCFKNYIFDVKDKKIECEDILEMNEYYLEKSNKVNIQAELLNKF
jgi:uncharacterized protein